MVDHADWCSVSFYLDGYTVTRWEYVFVLSYALIDLTILFDTMCIRLSIDNVYATYDDAAEAFDSTDEIVNRVVVEEEDKRSKRAKRTRKDGPLRRHDDSEDEDDVESRARCNRPKVVQTP